MRGALGPEVSAANGEVGTVGHYGFFIGWGGSERAEWAPGGGARRGSHDGRRGALIRV